MRFCPVCGSKDRIEDWVMDYLVPEGWGLPTRNTICFCKSCSMIYYDNDKTQADYDRYYSKFYDTEASLRDTWAHKRLDELAQLIVSQEPNKNALIVDFGGGEGYLEKCLKSFGFQNVQTVNVNQTLPDNIDLLVASQVLEHIYDLRGAMDLLILKVTGRFLVSVPDAVEMSKNTDMPILDYQQKHVNHFSIPTMNKLFEQYDYFPVNTYRHIFPPSNGRLFTSLYEKIDEWGAYSESKYKVKVNIAEKVNALKDVTEPVIVWGAGDICLHLLTKIKLNIFHYVDSDPAFIDHNINGVEVLDYPEGDNPILVIAQLQKDTILEKIKKMGLKNKVISP